MESSSSNIFNWLFGPKPNTVARDPLQCVPQSSSDSPKAPSPRGLVVSLELEQRLSEASAPAEAETSSPSDEEKKAKSNAAAEDQLAEMVVGRNESDNECDREKQDRPDCIKNEVGSTCSFIHAAPINIKTAEMNTQEKEGLKDTSGKAEFQTAKVKVEEKEESEENLLQEQDQCRAKETILEIKDEYVDRPTQNVKGAEPGVKGKEISKEMPGQTEHKAKLKVKEDSEDDPRQTEFVVNTAGKLTAPEKEEPLITGTAQCKAVKLNMKEKDGPKEEPGTSEVKAAKKKVKKKVESKVEPTQTKLQGSFGGVEAERGSNGEVENARTEVGGKQVKKEKVSTGEEGKAEVWSDNTIGNETEKGVNEKKEEAPRGGPDKHTKYPVRPEAEDCPYYMKTWTCKFGSNCKYSHPVQKKPKAAKQKMKEMEESKDKSGQTKSKVKKEEAPMEKSGQTKSKATKEKVKEKTDSTGNTRQFDYKVYSSPEGRKFGKGSKSSHKKTNSVPPPVGMNFMGLPMRPGVKDCTYFMLTATCTSDVNCIFNHPDPTLVIDDEPSSVQDSRVEGTSSQSTQQSSPFPIESTPFVSMEYSAYNTEWSLNEPPSPAFTMHSSTSEKCIYAASEEQWGMNDMEDPDHLGQPQHGYFSDNQTSQHENPKLD